MRFSVGTSEGGRSSTSRLARRQSSKMIVGRSASPPFVRELSVRDLDRSLEQSLAYAELGEVLIVAPDKRKYVLVSVGRFDELNAANRR